MQSCNLPFLLFFPLLNGARYSRSPWCTNWEVKYTVIDIESIGSRVKFHRLRNKISQEELADLAQISRVHISYLERGDRIPSLDSFIKIANALNVSADELLADNLLVTGNNMNSEELDILFDCSVDEQQILLRNMRALKDILRSYRISK